jgi:hypothetical protein
MSTGAAAEPVYYTSVMEHPNSIKRLLKWFIVAFLRGT